MLAATSFAADDPSSAPLISCGSGIPGGVNCVLTKKELKEARTAFTRGVKLEEHKQLEDAFTQFDEASRIMPQNPQFLNARELVKAQLVFNHVQRGNLLLLGNLSAEAATEFRKALELDPDDVFARERLTEAVRVPPPAVPAILPERLQGAGEIHLEPKNDLATFHFSGDIRGLFSELGMAYGVKAQFDDSVQNRQVQFNVDDVDFFTAH